MIVGVKAAKHQFYSPPMVLSVAQRAGLARHERTGPDPLALTSSQVPILVSRTCSVRVLRRSDPVKVQGHLAV
jgi:hypothetical protein